MTTESNIANAISRSISHNEIVAVEVAAMDIFDALAGLDCDLSVENDGSYDVSGTDDNGGEFRIRVTILEVA